VVHEGYATGENLLLVKDKLILQTWRASDWTKKDPDSTFMIYLEQKGKDTSLHMVHAHVPDEQAQSLRQGWHDFYWKPWKTYLKGEKKKLTRSISKKRDKVPTP
jgi:activator of HSP90 ATPase